MKKAILALAIAGAILESNAQTIRLYPVIDSLDERVGIGCQVSFERLRKFLQKIRPSVEGGIGIYTFKSVPTRDQIKNHYRDTVFQKDDILWFHYCGHGETDPDQGHILKVPGADVGRRELREWMEARGTQGVLLTTDACAVRGIYTVPEPLFQNPPPRPIDASVWKRFKALVGGIHGTVDLTASTGENPAFVDHQFRADAKEMVGALFTNSLMNLFETETHWIDINQDKSIDWGEAFAFVREDTRRMFHAMSEKIAEMGDWRKLSLPVEDQVPYAYALGNDLTLKRKASLPGILSAVRKVSHEGESKNYLLVQGALDGTRLGHDIGVGAIFRDKNGKGLPKSNAKFQNASGEAAVGVVFKNIGPGWMSVNDNQPWEIPFPGDAIPGEAEKMLIVVHDLTTKTNLYAKEFPLYLDTFDDLAGNVP